MRSNKSIIHIGYPKTATTWFQMHFYPLVKNYKFISRRDVHSILIEPDVFSYNSQKVSKIFNKSKKIIICEELLLGGTDIGFGNGSYIKEIVLRLKATFPDAKVVIFIRNQIDLIASWYYQYIKSGGTHSVKKFLFKEKEFDIFFKCYDSFSFKILEYDKIIELYYRMFGEDNVDIYLYEDFLYEKECFMERYVEKYNFILNKNNQSNYNIFINSRYSFFLIQLARCLNRFTRRNVVNKHYFFHIPFLFKTSFHLLKNLSNYWPFRNEAENYKLLGKRNIEFIESYYKESNRRLEDKYGVKKIKDYGYPL